MRNRLTAVLLLASLLPLAALVVPARGYQEEPDCGAPVLSDQAVKDIIERERATRTDLPPPYPRSRWVVRRQGCYYAYVEYAVPEAPNRNHIFKLNPQGAIVDATTGLMLATAPGKLKCPAKVLTKDELAEAVRKERGKRRNVPPPFANQETRVDRMRCLYLYYEQAVPKKKGHYQVFIIDPFGEVMDVQRGKPEQ